MIGRSLVRTRSREPVSCGCVQQPHVVRDDSLELVPEFERAGDMERIQRPHAARDQSAGPLYQVTTESDAINASKDLPSAIYELVISSKGCAQDLCN